MALDLQSLRQQFENDPEMDQLAYHVEVIRAGSFDLELSVTGQGTIGGAYKFYYLLG